MEIDSSRNFISLVHHTIDINSVLSLIKSPCSGAISTFIGTTRDNFEGKEVLSLEYEAYEEMALTCLQSICDSIRERWSVSRIAIVHKLGMCPITDISVVIAISSPHRKESLEAVAFAIDELKRTVPIWKKEHYKDSEPIWKENIEPKINPIFSDGTK